MLCAAKQKDRGCLNNLKWVPLGQDSGQGRSKLITNLCFCIFKTPMDTDGCNVRCHECVLFKNTQVYICKHNTHKQLYSAHFNVGTHIIMFLALINLLRCNQTARLFSHNDIGATSKMQSNGDIKHSKFLCCLQKGSERAWSDIF